MKTQPSKVNGIGIIPLRCEICFGNIEEGSGVIALLKDNSMHFAHYSCYDSNEPEVIVSRMNEIVSRTKNDQELFNLMEN